MRKKLDIYEFVYLAGKGLNCKQIAKIMGICPKRFGFKIKDIIGIYPSVFIYKVKNGKTS